MSREPSGVDGPNLYHYVGSDPIGFIDPDGLRRVPKIDQKTVNEAKKCFAAAIKIGSHACDACLGLFSVKCQTKICLQILTNDWGGCSMSHPHGRPGKCPDDIPPGFGPPPPPTPPGPTPQPAPTPIARPTPN